MPSSEAKKHSREGLLPTLVDTHCHLTLDDFRRDSSKVIERARAAGVGYMMNVGFDLSTSRASIELAEEHDFMRATVGVHPHDASTVDDSTLRELARLTEHPLVLAVGETGLDYYRDLSPREDQRRAFRRQIALARETGLPVVVHSRDAQDEVLRILEEEGRGDVRGVMHCFPGDEDYAARVVDLGFHIGIGGPVTFSDHGRLVGVAKTAPLNRILLETDSPWLAPKPHRGKRNEPAHVRLVAERISDLRGVSLPDVARATTGNCYRLFGFPDAGRPTIAYEMWGNLYLNITNRCTNRCIFCIRNETDVLWGYNLKLDTEPTADDVIRAAGDTSRYGEVVFCGYGEPTLRLDVIKEVGAALRKRGTRVRLDTNGQGNLIWNRNIAPELKDAVDAVSVSLNAQDAAAYDRICKSRYGEAAYPAVLSFVRECVKTGLEVAVSVVDVPEIDIEAARRVADELGVPLRVRGGTASRSERGG